MERRPTKRLASRTRENLHRDRRVQGARWRRTYGNYFGNRRTIAHFVRLALGHLPRKKKLDIFYPCSGTGDLGESLVDALHHMGREAKLTILDASSKMVEANANPETTKITGDLLRVQLRNRFDACIMRSSLDYFSEPKLQVRALKKVREHLLPGGVFFNQAASLATLAERQLADAIYRSNPRIGQRHFQCAQDIADLYHQAGFRGLKKIGEAMALVITEKEHRERYGFTPADIARIRALIRTMGPEKRKNIRLTRTGYRMRFEFPIYIATA